jgi:hypothetical protein
VKPRRLARWRSPTRRRRKAAAGLQDRIDAWVPTFPQTVAEKPPYAEDVGFMVKIRSREPDIGMLLGRESTA